MGKKLRLLLGDNLEHLRTMPDNSVDSIVTDPPYGLAFMGKRWDYDVPTVELWAECLRVLKPGGHLLAFAGTRTYHRMAVRIEDAGFEIRDMIAWVYSSGFPKSLDVSKAIDKAAGAERTERLAPKPGHESFVGYDHMKSLRESGVLSGKGGYSRPWMHDPQKVESSHWQFAPATEAARQWQGWGTALKPSQEPIVLARKPIVGTVAANVLEHGTGALNIDGCRVGTEAWARKAGAARPYDSERTMGVSATPDIDRSATGRWPANFIHDGSEEVVALFPEQDGLVGKRRTSGQKRIFNLEPQSQPQSFSRGAKDFGSAARFFYCAKASKRDRDEGLEGFALRTAGQSSGRADGSLGSVTHGRNVHPTVKPTDLMRYLCRLVTPPNGVVLDPFMGSGSTGKAAMLEGFGFIGMELEPEYYEIAKARIAHVSQRQVLL